MKKNIVFYILFSIVASALNYFAYPMLARLLPDTQYVDITVSLSLMTQVSAFMSALTAVTIGLTKKGGSEKGTISKLQTSLLQIFTLVGFLFLLLSPVIFPAIDTPVQYAVPIVIMIIVSIPITIISGYLNGKGSMTKLGSVALLTAAMQFITGGAMAAITHSGIATMTAMGLVQIISIIILANFLNEPHMPKLEKELFTFKIYSGPTRKLLIFTMVASFAIMAINILQVFDLLLVKNLGGFEARFYTDVYVISRILFFAGTILIWPFLASVSATDTRINRQSFLKLVGAFVILTLSALITLYFFGNIVSNILFGKSYDISLLRTVLSLSVLYKMFFLIITSCCLFVITQHSYRHFWLSLATAVGIIAAGVLSVKSMGAILTNLVVISGIFAVIWFFSVWLHKPKIRAIDAL